MTPEVRSESLGSSGLTMIQASADLLESLIADMLPLSSLPGVLIPPIYFILAGYKSWRLREVMENMNPPRLAPNQEAVYEVMRRQHVKATPILLRISAMREQISEAAVTRAEPRRQTGSSGWSTMSETHGMDHASPLTSLAPFNWIDDMLYIPEFDLAWLDVPTDPISTASQGFEYEV